MKKQLSAILLFVSTVSIYIAPHSAMCNTIENNIVKVFILVGQSNIEEAGTVEPNKKHLDKNGGMGTFRYLVSDSTQGSRYSHLIDASGKWSVRNDVWVADLDHSGPLTVKGKKTHGPELQFAHVVGDYYENPVLIIKATWGGKSLYTDYRPPSSGGEPGIYYLKMINRVRNVLTNIDKHVPGYQGQGYDIAGFGWHQGWNDRVNKAARAEYKTNCVNLINDLRDEFNVPDMAFVIATTGMKGWDETSRKALSLVEAQQAVPTSPGLKNDYVKVVETRDFWRDKTISPADQSYHWNRNAETYFLIGNTMGKSMIDLLSQKPVAKRSYKAKEHTNT